MLPAQFFLIVAANLAWAGGTLEADGFLPVFEESGALSPADVARIFDQLDAPEFAERQDASRRLIEAGKSVLPDLERAAAAASREVSGRAFDILKLHFEQAEADLKQAAKDALSRLAESSNSSIAQRARNVINPPRDLPGAMPFGPGFRGPNFQFGGGGPFPQQPFPTRTISSSDINGRKEVEIREGGRIVKMRTSPTGRIEMEFQDRENGPLKKIEAKDLNELKRKDAELGDLYEQYQQRARMPIGVVPMPVVPPPFRAPTNSAELARRMMEGLDDSINRYKARLPNDPNAQRMIDALEQIKESYRNGLPQPPLPQPARPTRPVETALRPVTR